MFQKTNKDISKIMSLLLLCFDMYYTIILNKFKTIFDCALNKPIDNLGNV